MRHIKIKIASACLLSLTLSACGGGGGSGGPSGGGDWRVTSEYTRNYGLQLINADSVYNVGGSGESITVAIIDSGINTNHSEFAGRINPASIDIVNDSFNITDVDGHGTWVAGVVAADYGSGRVQGVAYEADILAIDAYDENGPFGAGFYDIDTADAIRYAVDNGASVINMSLGGAGSSSTINSALRYAANAGVVVVIATGNDSERDFGFVADISEPAAQAGAAQYNGHVVAVGAVDSSGTVADFSSACNSTDARYCLVAPGENIFTTDTGGGYDTVDGTSFSAPHVAGAIALLMDAFPNLTGQQAVEIILSTAHDIGSFNPNFNNFDNDYGNGLLDLEAAIGPSGSLTTTAGDLATSVSTAQLELSSAFGDALSSEAAFANMVLYDFYERAYQSDLSGRIRNDESESSLAKFTDFTDRPETNNANVGSLQASFTTQNVTDDFDQRETTEVLGFTTTTSLGKGTKIGFSHGGANVGGVEFGFVSNANKTYSITDNAVTPYAFLTSNGQGVSLNQSYKGWNLSYGIRAGNNDDYTAYAADIRAEKQWDTGTYVGLRGSMMLEDDSFLGATGTGAFNGGYAAQTSAVTLAVGQQFENLILFGQVSTGITSVSSGSNALLTDFADIKSQAAMLGMTYNNLASAGDSLSITISKPLRVSSGSAVVNADIASQNGVIVDEETRVSLSPSGSQTNIELGYRATSKIGGVWGFGLAYVIDPDHRADADAEISAGVTYRRDF